MTDSNRVDRSGFMRGIVVQRYGVFDILNSADKSQGVPLGLSCQAKLKANWKSVLTQK